MSNSDSGTDSDDDRVLPFEKLFIGDVILDTSDLFAMRVIMSPKKKWCYHCHGHKDSELEEFYEDPCSACGEDMNNVSLRDFWYEIEGKLSQSQLYDDVYKFLVGLGLKYYSDTPTCLDRHEDRVALGRIIVKYASDVLSMEGMKIRSSFDDE